MGGFPSRDPGVTAGCEETPGGLPSSYNHCTSPAGCTLVFDRRAIAEELPTMSDRLRHSFSSGVFINRYFATLALAMALAPAAAFAQAPASAPPPPPPTDTQPAPTTDTKPAD